MSLLDLLDHVGERPRGQVARETRTLVLLCADLAERGLDLDAVRSALEPLSPGVAVEYVAGLCDRPGAAAEALRRTDATRAVLGLCRRQVAEADLLARARRAGAEPFGVELVRLPTGRGAPAAAALLEASLARLAALPGGEPGRAVPTGAGLSRRALLTLAPSVSLLPVAAVEAFACVGFERCGVCANACPYDAVGPGAHAAAVDPARCESCGRCVAACPTGAVRLAGASRAQLETQLAVLLESGEWPGIVFACRGAVSTLDRILEAELWATVEVPALSIVTAGWVLQALVCGAGAVRLLPCEGDCCAGWRSGGRLELCRTVLGSDGEDRIALLGAGGVLERPRPAGARARRPALAEPVATARAAVELAADGVRCAGACSPLGLLRLDSDRCTLCGACATACPTAALEVETGGGAIALRHRPGACCGCGLCVRACPELALAVQPGVDVELLRAGSLELARTSSLRCRRCGAELAPAAAGARVRGLLAEGFPQLAARPANLCPDCLRRGA